MKLLPFDYAARNLGRSPSRLVLSVLGSALVVALVLAAAAFVRGMALSLRASGNEHSIIIVGAGSEESIERSEVDSNVAGIIGASIPGIRSQGGVSYVSPEVHVMLPVKLRAEQPKGPLITVRGVTLGAMLVHAHVRIEDGRFPTPGREEVMVGGMAAMKMGVRESDLGLGGTILIDQRPWTIVGRFSAPGTVTEAEIWTGLQDLKTATKRDTDSCIVITLDPDRAEFADVAIFTKTRVDLELSAIPERAYYARLSSFFAPIRLVAWITAALIGVGGLFGGLNTMYAAFVSRVRELGTLQSLGFRRIAIVISLVQESSLATAAGAILASLIGVFVLDGLAVRFSMGVFGLVVDAPVLAIGVVSGLVLGLVGALPPAYRCLRLSIPVALKSV